MRVRTVVNFLACLLFIYIFVYMAHGFLKYTYLSILKMHCFVKKNDLANKQLYIIFQCPASCGRKKRKENTNLLSMQNIVAAMILDFQINIFPMLFKPRDS